MSNSVRRNFFISLVFLGSSFHVSAMVAENLPPPSASVCVPAEQTSLGNSLKEAGWACVEILPSLGNAVNAAIGSDQRFSVRENWELYQRGELWNVIAEQNGLGPNGPGFFRAQWRGLVAYVKNIAGNNESRLTHPGETVYNTLNATNAVVLQTLKDALVPARGILYELGAPVQYPSNREWGQSYVSLAAWMFPLSRTGTALRLSEKAENSISEMGAQLSQRAAATADAAKNGMNQVAQSIRNSGGPPLCYAEATAFGMGEAPFCVFPKSTRPFTTAIEPPLAEEGPRMLMPLSMGNLSVAKPTYFAQTEGAGGGTLVTAERRAFDTQLAALEKNPGHWLRTYPDPLKVLADNPFSKEPEFQARIAMVEKRRFELKLEMAEHNPTGYYYPDAVLDHPLSKSTEYQARIAALQKDRFELNLANAERCPAGRYDWEKVIKDPLSQSPEYHRRLMVLERARVEGLFSRLETMRVRVSSSKSPFHHRIHNSCKNILDLVDDLDRSPLSHQPEYLPKLTAMRDGLETKLGSLLDQTEMLLRSDLPESANWNYQLFKLRSALKSLRSATRRPLSATWGRSLKVEMQVDLRAIEQNVDVIRVRLERRALSEGNYASGTLQGYRRRLESYQEKVRALPIVSEAEKTAVIRKIELLFSSYFPNS